MEIRLFSISSAAVLTNNSCLFYEKLLLPYLIPLNLVQNSDKLEHYKKSFTKQLPGLKSGSSVELKQKYSNGKN